MTITINSERFLKTLKEQVQFGDTEDGGVSRPALSLQDVAIRNWFQRLIENDELEYGFDGAGNQSAIWRCGRPNAKTLLIGSHLDSVQNGGRFDGVLGVLAAYEVLLRLRETNAQLPFDLEVINFTDEEGSILGLMGSSALAGILTADRLANPRGGREALLDGMRRIGISEESALNAKRPASSICGYIEVHIEQGTRLQQANQHIGVVPSIVGRMSYRLRFLGEAGHAGTTPMDARHDAFQGAAAFSARARRLVIDHYAPGVINFGVLSVLPGAYNIIPNEAILGVEFRHGIPTQFEAMQRALIELASQVAVEHGLRLEYQLVEHTPPALMSERLMRAVESAANSLGLSHARLMSFAGHDSQALWRFTETVMLFVPSLNGVSHNPKEFSSDQDCVNGANVLLQTVLQWAKEMVEET